jgi:hypothetical protein
MNVALKHQIIEKIIQSDDDETLREIALMLEVDRDDLYTPLPNRFRLAINQFKEQIDRSENIRPSISRAKGRFTADYRAI